MCTFLGACILFFPGISTGENNNKKLIKEQNKALFSQDINLQIS